MPDPQTLQDELALRAQAQDPTLNSPIKRAARGAIDFGMGALGLGDQGPAGPTPTNAGQVLGAALPLGVLPEGLIRSLMNLPETKAPEATSKLLGLLNNFKGLSGADAKTEAVARLAGDGSTGYLIPQPTSFGQLYRNAASRIPEVADTLTPGAGRNNINLPRPPGFTALLSRQRNILNNFKPTLSPEQDLQRVMLDRASRPMITNSADIGLAAQSAAPAITPPSRPPLSGLAAGKPQKAALSKSGLTEDAIRKIRTMSIADAQKEFPNLSNRTIDEIRRRNSFVWVK